MTEPPKDLFDVKLAATTPAREVLEYLYQAILAIPPFTLRDGAVAKVEKYYPPEMNDSGDLKCGIDVRLPDGSQLEFTVANTGWEKSFVADHMKKRGPKPRQR